MNHSQNPQNHQRQLSVPVRKLAETLYRRGGLFGVDFGGIDGAEGIRAHQRAVQWLQTELGDRLQCFSPEHSLAAQWSADRFSLELRGRADALMTLDHQTVLVEIKSFRGKSEQVPPEGDPLHWAQAMLYAAIHALNDPQIDRDEITLLLIYASVDEPIFLERRRIQKISELKLFFEESCRQYLDRVANLILWKERRNEAALRATFPFRDLRLGQAEMMREVLAVLIQKESLFVQAPTGIGKTMAVLYPAMKALASGDLERVFYATAMTSTRKAAEEALATLRAAGFLIRSLTLQAKEKLCLCPDLFCDQALCPYALSYYDHLPDALEALLIYEELRSEEILTVAEKFQLCPFELSLDIALYCDLVIGDYNHIFDPRVRLKRLVDEEKPERLALLVDEAHNLPRRAVEMFSAEMTEKSLDAILKLFEDSQSPLSRQYASLREQSLLLQEILRGVARYFSATQDSQTPNPLANVLIQESLVSDWLVTDDFIGLRGKPDKLIREIGREIFLLRQFLDENRQFNGRREILLSFFEFYHFFRIADQYFGISHIFAARRGHAGLRLFLLCLDASEPLTELYDGKHATIFFSATLSPFPYYCSMLNHHVREGHRPLRLLLPSPFPEENCRVLALSSLSFRYKDRRANIAPALEIIMDICSHKIGNYLVFVPSYQYLAEIREVLKKMPRPEHTEFMLQRPRMGEKQKRFFIQRFEDYGQKSLIAFAVLGSLFNEGIDLRGERLSGVVIIGVGLPPPSPEREILTQHYQERFGDGYLYAYVCPGINRIQQAAGRLIRSEEDRGFILLLDRRWKEMPYSEFLPESWHCRFHDDADELSEDVRDFWQDGNS